MPNSKQSNGNRSDYDAVIVGASLAGCTTAIALGRAGASVALVEKQPDPAAFKRMCSHFIQASAVPALERLDLLEPIIEAGGVRSRMRAWTPWGWIEAPPSQSPRGGQPAARAARPAAARDGRRDPGGRADAGPHGGRGWCARARPSAASSCATATARRRRCDAAAGGRRRRSRLAHRRAGRGEDEGLAARALRLRRLFRRTARRRRRRQLDLDARPATGRPPSPPTAGSSSTRRCRPRTACPSSAATRRRALVSFVGDIPEAPPIRASRLVGPVLGKIEMPNKVRVPVAPGLALVGDAALAVDPLFGVGCGWAFQSAEWLADSVAPALRGDELAAGRPQALPAAAPARPARPRHDHQRVRERQEDEPRRAPDLLRRRARSPARGRASRPSAPAASAPPASSPRRSRGRSRSTHVTRSVRAAAALGRPQGDRSPNPSA